MEMVATTVKATGKVVRVITVKITGITRRAMITGKVMIMGRAMKAVTTWRVTITGKGKVGTTVRAGKVAIMAVVANKVVAATVVTVVMEHKTE